MGQSGQWDGFIMMPIYRSNYLSVFAKSMLDAHAEEEKDALWHRVENPVIEDIPGQMDKLVTFLYRLSNDELDRKTSIYFLSGVAGYDFTEQSKFAVIPHTNIAYLSLVLPCQLRSAYNLVKRYDEDSLPLADMESAPSFYPKLIGESAKFEVLLNDLYAKGRVATDPLNKKEIIYYKDMEHPDELYGKESILELPMAPCLEAIPTTFEFSKSVRDRLREEGRLIQDQVQFSETCLRGVSGYDDPSSMRRYWIYLPKDYDPIKEDAYPLMLFLDGSSYLDYIPAHCILEKMIEDGVIPPCVAVFFDCVDGIQRSVEYNCNDLFTEFLTQDFMKLLRVKHGLNITTDSKRSTIIGASFGGLAAYYVGLTKPNIFGNVIAQSPAFLAQRLTSLDKIITDFAEQNSHSSFIFEMGSYENISTEFEFEDGATQSISSLDVVLHVCEQMRKKSIPVNFHKFVGGHNYVCYRVSLYDRIKEVNDHSLSNVIRKTTS